MLSKMAHIALVANTSAVGLGREAAKRTLTLTLTLTFTLTLTLARARAVHLPVPLPRPLSLTRYGGGQAATQARAIPRGVAAPQERQRADVRQELGWHDQYNPNP